MITVNVLFCGSDNETANRDDCPDQAHDHPLPVGYAAAVDVAKRRLRKGWKNVRCEQCGLWGWRKP